VQRYDIPSLRALVERVAVGELTPEAALEELRGFPFAALGDAQVDHHRELRTGIPEVVFGQGKSRAQIERIVRELHARSGFALATRVAEDEGAALVGAIDGATYDAIARVLRYGALARSGRRVAVVSAGTSDLPVAEEAAVTADAFGHDVLRAVDVGVAGLHRLLPAVEALDACNVVIVVAGMEGALPSVVAGLVRPPVVAVPTSVGYGASFGGLAALLAMLNSCAPGVATVNIDNGFGAACVAHKIVSRASARG
jgi:pyridinium-3,5-biscarboxylic acid mononucleotide synthase